MYKRKNAVQKRNLNWHEKLAHIKRYVIEKEAHNKRTH